MRGCSDETPRPSRCNNLHDVTPIEIRNSMTVEPQLADAPKVDKKRLAEEIDALRNAAEIIHPGIGRKLYTWWDEINREHFGRQMSPPGIQFGLTPHGSRLGLWRGSENVIVLHRSLVKPSGNAWDFASDLNRDGGGEAYCRDVLLHEMVHQYIRTVRGVTSDDEEAEGTSSHNNPWWVAEVNRISPRIGLDVQASVIRQKRVDGSVTWYVPDGHLTMEELSTWPYGTTQPEWYTGEADSRQP